jgi:hypothetical protein
VRCWYVIAGATSGTAGGSVETSVHARERVSTLGSGSGGTGGAGATLGSEVIAEAGATLGSAKKPGGTVGAGATLGSARKPG